MSKGIETRGVFFIVAVIFGILALFIIFKVFPSLYNQIMAALGFVKPSNVEQAILCSYHRCIDGCMSMKVQEISWKEGDSSVSCQNFCNSTPTTPLPNDAYKKNIFGQMEKELRVCNPEYPVTINLKKSEKIEKTHLTLGSTTFGDVGCILPTDLGQSNTWDAIKYIFGGAQWQQLVNQWTLLTGGTISENWLVIDAGLIKSYGNKEDCVEAMSGIMMSHDSLKDLTIKDNQKINITTDFLVFGPVNIVSTSVYK
jgi:hypothetical protein